MHHARRRIRAGAAAIAVAMLVSAGADGTQTQVWEVSTHDEFAEGTFEGTRVDSAGEVSMGIETLRAEVPGTAAVWSSLAIGSDTYLGTGNEGALWMIKGDRLVKLTETDAVALTALETDGSGALFAGSLPGGAIYRFDDDELKKLAKKASAGAPKVKWEPGREFGKDKKKKKKKDKKKSTAEKKEGEKQKSAQPAGKSGEKEEKAAGKADKGKKGEKKGGKADKGKKKKAKKGPEPWTELEDADHVWALAWDPKKGTLYAGTGPEGIVYAIDASGRATVLADTDEEHILSLAVAPDGSVLAGTANHAMLLSIDGPGRVETVWDFDATEVKSLALLEAGKGKEPVVVAAVNKFKSPPKVSAKMPSKQDISSPKKSKSSFTKTPDGEGLIAAILPAGGYRELNKSKKTHFTHLMAAGKAVHAATGSGGRVLEIDLEGRHSVILDCGERQVLTFDLTAKRPVLGTSDPAAVHRVLPGPPSDPLYVSEVFDAGFPARWGRFVLRGKGTSAWQTRTGNTEEPDETWSGWTSPVKSAEGKVKSPASRFIQFRLSVGGESRVWNTQLFYLPYNQQATIKEISFGDGKASNKSGSKKASKSSTSKKGSSSGDPEIKIGWKVENADGDPLRYELWFAREGTAQWIAILEEGEVLEKTEYKWDTTSVPAGHYLVKVAALDDQVNDPALALAHEQISKPLLVDNDPPKVTLSAKGGKGKASFSGSVEDAFSEVSRIEISVDGGPWKTLFPKDLIFDEQKEAFSHTMDGLEKGPHTATVRAWDRRNNGTSAGAHFKVK
jgi:hypothetical protein